MEIVSQNAIKTGFFSPFGRNQRRNALFTLCHCASAPLCLCSFVPQRIMKRKIKNKANFRKEQMNVRSIIARDYEEKPRFWLEKQSQFVFFTAENAELAEQKGCNLLQSP